VLIGALEPGSCRLLVRDLCLSVEQVAATNLLVHGVVRIDLEVVDKIQLGRSATGLVKLFAANDKVRYCCCWSSIKSRDEPDTVFAGYPAARISG
jgi:hypothetical protein